MAIFNDANVQSLGVNIFSGAASGILGAAAGSPFFLVKTRLQSFSPFLPVGTQHGYKNTADGLGQIGRTEGVKGLYRGVGAAMVRTGFGSSVQLPTYFFAKRRLVRHLGMGEGPALHLASSAASGVVVCCVMHPPGTVAPNPRVPDGRRVWNANASENRHHHVAHVQPDRQSLQRRDGLRAQNRPDGRCPGHLQGLFRPPGPHLTAHDPHAHPGRTDEQVHATGRGSCVTKCDQG